MLKNLSRAQQQRSTRAHRGSLFIGFLGLLVLAGIFLFRTSTTTSDIPTNEVEVSVMKATHVSNTDAVVYNSNPPTSGPHFSDWHKDWTFYDSALPIGGLIHNMEHGGVVLFYQSSLDEATKDQLKAFTEDNFKMIASVKEDLPAPIALAAWGVYELFDAFDEEAMKRFYKKHRDHAPENVYP